MASTDKNWAEQYINNPLTAPDPSDETGPGTSFRVEPESFSTIAPKNGNPSTGSSPGLRKSSSLRHSHGSPKETMTTSRELRPDSAYPSPPPSASPRYSPRHSPRNSLGHRQEFMGSPNRPRRSSSLKERFPGDPTVRPLDQLTKEKAAADRAKHVTKKHAIRPDSIDGLDASGVGSYHHEGPYDATLFARNNSWESSPVAAVSTTNEEALKATPHERIVDSVQRHRPLDGVAEYPPGTTDRTGQTYNYTEGENLMIDENAGGGPYKRWAGIDYHPDDIKGKGEPSYSIEKALKDHSLAETDNNGIEMTSNSNRSRASSGAHRAEFLADGDGSLNRSGSLSNRLKKRVGSLKKKFVDTE